MRKSTEGGEAEPKNTGFGVRQLQMLSEDTWWFPSLYISCAYTYTKHDPRKRFWTQMFFCFPHFLIIGNRLHSATMTFFEFPTGRLKQLLVTEGMWRQGGIVKRNNNAVLGGRFLVLLPPRAIYNNIFELFADASPTRRKKFTLLPTSV